MQGNVSSGTLPELVVRRLLHARGFRFRVNFQPEPNIRRTADIVFTRAMVAVFIDGCFWHNCPEHGRVPRTNVDYWAPKLAQNALRDKDTNVRLDAAGWRVRRFWEHQAPDEVAAEIIAEVQLKAEIARPYWA